jgi:hypothetical protein
MLARLPGGPSGLFSQVTNGRQRTLIAAAIALALALFFCAYALAISF